MPQGTTIKLVRCRFRIYSPGNIQFDLTAMRLPTVAGVTAAYLTLSLASAARAYNRASVMLSTQPSMLTIRPAT